MDMAMDSGTTSIWLHPTAYTLLSNALKDATHLTNAYEDCYFGTMKDVIWISITFQFHGGVDVKYRLPVSLFKVATKYPQLYIQLNMNGSHLYWAYELMWITMLAMI